MVEASNTGGNAVPPSSSNTQSGVQFHANKHDAGSYLPNKSDSNTTSQTANSQQQLSGEVNPGDLIITAGSNKNLKGLRYSDVPLEGWRSLLLTVQINAYFIGNGLVGMLVHLLYFIFGSLYSLMTYPVRQLLGWHPIYRANAQRWVSSHTTSDGSLEHPYAVVIIGSGFSGLAMSIHFLQQGMRHFVLLERRHAVAGTWNDNTYPGAACDIPSYLYSFSFEAWPHWTHLWSGQQQIQQYLQHCADKYGVMQHVQFNTTVQGAEWREERQMWEVRTTGGPDGEEGKKYYAKVLINGQGFLSDPSIPKVPGLQSFKGKTWHSAQWDHSFDLQGKRVAVVGSGASAVQFVPIIQPKVKSMVTFIRTPAWVKPHVFGKNWPVPESVRQFMVKHPQPLHGFLRMAAYWMLEGTYLLLSRARYGQGIIQKEALRHLFRATDDPELRKKLIPTYEFGCKRLLLSNTYIPALCASNNTVANGAITEVRENAVVDEQGRLHEVDAIIFATGFAVQRHEAKNALQITGRDGIRLNDVWKEQLVAYKGTTIAGFPNYFTLLGPSTNLGHNSVVYMAECQATYILQALAAMSQKDITSVDVKEDVMQRFDSGIQKSLETTVWNSGGCNSWYLDSKGRNGIIWPLFTWIYMFQTSRFDLENYHVNAADDSKRKATKKEL